MSDELRRLLDDDPGAELRSVLESGLRDQPSPRTMNRAARTLGIAAASLGSARAAASTAALRALHSSPWTALAKWGGAGVLMGTVALSPLILNPTAPLDARVLPRTAARVRAVPSAPPLRQPPPTHDAKAANVVSVPPAALVPTTATPLVSSTAAVARSAPELAVRTAHQPPVRSAQSLASESSVPNGLPAVKPADLLDNEVALLDSTRAALKHRDPTAALVLLDRQARLSARSLDAEATLLRVQALVLAGRSAEARAIARAALRATSRLPYAARLRQVAGLAE